MKKIIFLLTFLLITNLNANAYVDSQYTSTEQFLVNTGYSVEAAKILQRQKKDVYSPVEKLDNRTIYQKVLNYIDPMYKSSPDFPNHNVNFNESSWEDL